MSTGLSETSGVKPIVQNADMPEEMQQRVFELTEYALKKFKVQKEVASYLKKEMDKQFGKTWHCIVGTDFGNYVSHERNNFIYFYVNKLAILLFKTA